jgi:hypothetical protein
MQRAIEEILEELKNHPDYIYVELWTKDDIEYDFYQQLENWIGDNYEHLYDKLDDISIELDDKDWDYFKENTMECYHHLWNLNSWYGHTDKEPVPYIENLPPELLKRIKREINLKIILEDEAI